MYFKFQFVFLVYQSLQLVQTLMKYKDTSNEAVVFGKNTPDHESIQSKKKPTLRFETSELSFLISVFY